jgi:hypothetical protein
MNRLIIASAVAVAAAAVSVPAVAGLTNNPSFRHGVPVRVPSQAKVLQLDDHGKVVSSRPSEHPASTTVTSPTRSGAPEPGDDSGRSTSPGDDRGRSTSPGDDRGRSSSPADDRGSATEPGDDSGGHGAGSGGSGGSGGGDGHG